MLQLSRVLFLVLFMVVLTLATTCWVTSRRDVFTEKFDGRAYDHASRTVIEAFQSVLNRHPTDDELASYVSAVMLGKLHEKEVKELLRSTHEFGENNTCEADANAQPSTKHTFKHAIDSAELDVMRLVTTIPSMIGDGMSTAPSNVMSDKPIRKFLDKMNEQGLGWRAESQAALADHNACDDLVLDPSQKWKVPEPRPPVCVTSRPSRICSSTDQTSLIGTLLRDANDTSVGSIMPKFKFHSDGDQCHR